MKETQAIESHSSLLADSSRQSMQSATRTIELLFAIAASPFGLSESEIAMKFDLVPEAIHDVVPAMLNAGIVQQNSQGRFVLGPASVAIADGLNRQNAALDDRPMPPC